MSIALRGRIYRMGLNWIRKKIKVSGENILQCQHALWLGQVRQVLTKRSVRALHFHRTSAGGKLEGAESRG